MPGVVVLPPTTPFRFESSKTAMQNGYSPHEESVAEIKERAKEKAYSAAKGSSGTTLMKVAQDRAWDARHAEEAGDLKKALESLTQSSCLIQLLLNGTEFKNESQPGKKGVFYKEVNDWMQAQGKDIMARTGTVESKLKDLEAASPSSNGSAPRSIANRIALLQNAGLSVSIPKKPATKEIPNAQPRSNPPPTLSSSMASRLTIQISSPLSPSPRSPPLSMPTPREFVPTSSFGPPSPSSSASSSPRLNQFSPGSVTEFTQQFPTIDELEEMAGLKLATTGSSFDDPAFDMHTTSGKLESSHPHIPVPKPFPAVPFDLSQRPSSTPIPASIDALISRPASPTKSPLVPTVLRKQSNLSLNSGQKSPFPPSAPMTPGSSPRTDRPDLPKLPKSNVTTPQELHDFIQTGYKALLLDVRPREEFEREHIKADAVVCLEPIVLLRENVTGESIEDSLHVAPRNERTLFTNRDKFDLVAIYDNASETFGPDNGAMLALSKAIYEMAFKKMLRHTPMLLVGGLQSWKQQFGDSEIGHGTSSNGAVTPSTSEEGSFTRPRVISPLYTQSRSGTGSIAGLNGTDSVSFMDDKFRPSVDSIAGPSRLSSPEANEVSALSFDAKKFPPRKHSLPRPSSIARMDPPLNANINGSSSSIQYPAYPRSSPATSSPIPSSPRIHDLTLPPTASINPYPMSRRRSDYQDQTQDAMSSYNARPIDYPDLSSAHVLRPPPAAASSVLERQDNRPRVIGHSHSSTSLVAPKPPTIQSDYPVTYWSDTQIGLSGLKNLGNTCYMNSTIQCLSATVPFARFFTDGRWKSAINMVNPLGTKGNLAHSFASILHEMWQAEMPYLTPLHFRRSICSHASQFSGSDQHDSQEFLSFLLDGLHEDLNRILAKPTTQPTPEREAELERLPPHIASEQEWEMYRSRNDSIIVDFFQGQFRNKLQCLTCKTTSTTYNAFMYLTLPIPTPNRGSKVSLQACLDALVNQEVMEKSDAWNCPHCKALRKATKQLSLSRLPPILLINLKRFSFKGPFTDKIESFVEFPLKGLDLTNYMPKLETKFGGPLPVDDPRAQNPPYTYDLYAVTNHFGSLSSGHYTAFVASRGGWMYCDDSRVTSVDAKEVVGKPAYVLFYKRTKA